MRLNRYLSICGAASRRKGEDIIRAGRVAVNGRVVRDPASGVTSGADIVTLDGKTLTVKKKRRYLVLNKPAGVIVTRQDTHGRRTVYDVLGHAGEGLFTVGRLDADTTGVILLTDDGDLAHRLMHPSYEVNKRYMADVRGRVSADDVRTARRGIHLEDGNTAPAEMKVINVSTDSSTVVLTIHEGKKRQVKRMMSAIGHPVTRLERLEFAGITADRLARGTWRALTPQEVRNLKRMTNIT